MTTTRTNANEDGMLKLATACASEGQYGQAIVRLKALLEENAEHEIANGMLAGIYAQLNMPDRAEEYFRRVLAINPSNTLARFQLGLLQLSSQQPQKALDMWLPCLEDEDEFLIRFHCGLALLQLDRVEEAHSFFLHTMNFMPPDHWLYPQLQQLLNITPTSV